MAAEGEQAPSFEKATDGGGTLALGDLKGRKVVLYFYPKDDTPGCTKEAEGFRDAIADFDAAGASVVGVSKDSVARHDKFKAKYDLPFALVSDDDGSLCEAYGVWIEKKNYGRTYMGIERSTFLIDESGKIAKAWRKVRVKDHVAAVLEATRNL